LTALIKRLSPRRILELMSAAGFEKPTPVTDRDLLFGRVVFVQATAPA
jgi:hypothetical protein